MELGQYQLHVFVSLVVILGAAGVALICDFLKGSNEQLRELTIELKVRREEEHKRSLLMTPRPISNSVAAPAIASSSPASIPSAPLAVAAAPIKMSDARPAPATAVRTRRDRGVAKRPVAAEALAAMQRGAAMAASPSGRNSAEASRSAFSARTTDDLLGGIQPPVDAPSEPKVEIIPPQAAQGARPNALSGTSRPRTNWGVLLAQKAQAASAQSAAQAKPAVTISQDPLSPEAPVPAGFHDGYVLSRLVQSHKPVTGLVVSIGVSDEKANGEAASPAVRDLIQSLMGPQDFACASAPDEYLLIFPQERGAAAQRRLSQISQKLWDFQLRSLGEASILFSWGGVEVREESIEEAIASANERMQETRRGRSAKAFENRGLKIAV